MATIRNAEAADVERMMPLVRGFYVYEKLVLDEGRYRELALELIANENLGRLLVIETENELIGYAVIGFGFSLEFGGRDALLDEFYLLETRRGQGIGTQLISVMEEFVARKGSVPSTLKPTTLTSACMSSTSA